MSPPIPPDPADTLPGYRRRIRIVPGLGRVRAVLEDDFHCMSVTLRHRDQVVTAVEPQVLRAPWSTCPGAEARLVETFVGRPLAGVTARREKTLNCTHLHDLAVLAATHAADHGACNYEVVASDPLDGERILLIRRDGATVLRWIERHDSLVEPPALAGRTLFTLRDWIADLPPAEQEPARLLQWAAIIAHGRTIPIERQSDATKMPANCYTFQPERARIAKRIGESLDFSEGSRLPLAAIGGDV